MDLQSALSRLGYQLIAGRIPATPELVGALERDFQFELPGDYREFLIADWGGGWVNAKVSLQDEVTPVGAVGCIDSFHGFMSAGQGDDLRAGILAFGCAPDMLPIATDLSGNSMMLMLRGPHRGSVFYYDYDRRASWSDETFHEMFDNLAQSVRAYLAHRASRTLRPRVGVPKHLYLAATSFTALLEQCRNADDK